MAVRVQAAINNFNNLNGHCVTGLYGDKNSDDLKLQHHVLLQVKCRCTKLDSHEKGMYLLNWITIDTLVD